MDFDYTEEQRHLRDEARRFPAVVCPPQAARRVLENQAVTHDAALWTRIVEQGWLGVAIPEVYGGLGLGHVELRAIAEEIGAALAPVPFGSTLYLFAEAVLAAGSDAQKAAILPAIVEGRAIGCAALFEGPGELDFSALSARVLDGRLTGAKIPVVAGGIADLAVVLAVGDRGPGLYLARLDDPSVVRTRLEAVDGSVEVSTLAFDATPVEPLEGIDRAAIETLMAGAAVLYAFEQIGGADRCLALTVDYVKARHAFGGPVGRFQAVKHKLADQYVAAQLARSHVYHGAWAMDRSPVTLIQAAAAARIAASDAYWRASSEMIHLHGAIGFTWEHDAHLFYHRAHLLSLAVGGSQWWKDRLFEALSEAAT